MLPHAAPCGLVQEIFGLAPARCEILERVQPTLNELLAKTQVHYARFAATLDDAAPSTASASHDDQDSGKGFDAGHGPAALKLSYSLATSHSDVEEFISQEWRASEVEAGHADLKADLQKDFLPDCGGTKVLAESKSPKVLVWLHNEEGTRIGFASATVQKGRRTNFVRLERFYVVSSWRRTISL